MRNPRVGLLLLLLVIVVALSAFFVLRARGDAEAGPPLALCPGPDQYGYRCQPGSEFTYIDAVNDTRLYADDGIVLVDLPFDFTYYGRSYQQVALSSNGNLQFTTENPAFANECLNSGPVAGMGELISPYWDDLDLTFTGFLETAVTGESGSRIFTIEWDDIPSFINPDDTVTFEVQLHEGSNDIVFLYQDVNRSQGGNGRSATIGLQSETLGNTLQYGCNQLALSNGLAVLFTYPENRTNELGRSPQPLAGQGTAEIVPKGDFGSFIERLNQDGINGLAGMRTYLLAQQPQRDLLMFQADVTNDGREELIVLLRPPLAFAEHTQLGVFSEIAGENGQSWQLIYENYPLARGQNDPSESGRYYEINKADDLIDLLPPF